MNCNNSTKKLKVNNLSSGINQKSIEKAQIRMRFFLGFMDGVLKDASYCHLRGQKYACVENLVLQQGRFFDFVQERMHTSNPFKSSLDFALKTGKGYCEGFVLPYQEGIPILHAWVVDTEQNTIVSSQSGLHYGVAFEPNFALRHIQATGVSGIFKPDNRGRISILDFGFPKNSLFKG